MELIDLHTHSSASDGTDSPAEIVRKAKELGLCAVALTDHDTVEGLAEAQTAARDLGIKLIRGCEVSSLSDQGEMHILGLWIPQDTRELENLLHDLKAKRQKRNEAIVRKLNALGLNISMDEVRGFARGSQGRPHIAAALQARGYVQSREEAFKEYLGLGGKAYVAKNGPSSLEVTRLLARIGATVSLAHPLLRPRPDAWLGNFVGGLAANGLTALECWHSSMDEAQSLRCLELARRFKLCPSGGSDYHGENRPGISLGFGRGKLRVPALLLEDLEKARRARNLPC